MPIAPFDSDTPIPINNARKPRLSTKDIWNMSFGFLGIQAGFALQNSNASGILQRYGADVHELPNFWLVAPVIGMIVQPIIGYYSDRTWTRMGRRKPFFLSGAIAAVFGMILMPNAGALSAALPPVLLGAGMLMIMDASFNVAMEPFRALVADKLPSEQRTAGAAVAAGQQGRYSQYGPGRDRAAAYKIRLLRRRRPVSHRHPLDRVHHARIHARRARPLWRRRR
jgi:MFS family permease